MVRGGGRGYGVDPSWRIAGVDVGGTFTDFLYWDGRAFHITKRPSTVDDPSRAVLEGISAMGWQPTEVVHGSTVATNTLLTRSGVKAALITTKGFGDTLVIGRQARPDLYALHPTRPPPLIPDALRFEVDERVAPDGSVVTALNLDEVETILDRAERRGVEAIAVCLLFSFANPDHERRIVRAAAARGIYAAASSDVLPEPREFERMSTTAVNVYVSPPMTRYLAALERGLSVERPVRLRIMQSNGGSIGAEQAGREAVRTVLSGPAGGVVGAFAAAQQAGLDNVITFDMGGTSADVSLCPGRLLERTDLVVDGLPIKTPAVDVHTVGAGGGSIGWFDPGGALRVGPQSAGADPGPAAYGRGRLPTVTDAHVVLGRLRPDRFLGGAITLDAAAAERAVGSLAKRFNGSTTAAAQAIIDVVNANMARALRVISVERGHDPNDFTLLAFGGAGALHACDLADQLGIPAVMVPPTPGVLSAAGMLLSDVSKDEAQGSVWRMGGDASGTIGDLRDAYASLEKRARAALAEDGYTKNIVVRRSADLRYVGQSHEINVPLGRSLTANAIRQALAAAHEERFGHVDPTRDVEVAVARVKAIAPGFPETIRVQDFEIEETPPQRASVVWDRPRRTEIRERRAIGRSGIQGPAVLSQFDTTILVPPGWRARPDSGGNLNLRRSG